MTTAEKMTNANSLPEAGTGRVVRVTGPVVDVEFPRDQVPPLFNALTVEVDFEADLERANALFAERSPLQPVTGDPA